MPTMTPAQTTRCKGRRRQRGFRSTEMEDSEAWCRCSRPCVLMRCRNRTYNKSNNVIHPLSLAVLVSLISTLMSTPVDALSIPSPSSSSQSSPSSSSLTSLPLTPSTSPWAPALWSLRLDFFGFNHDNERQYDSSSNMVRLAVAGPVLVSSTDVPVKEDDAMLDKFLEGRRMASELRPLTEQDQITLLKEKTWQSAPSASMLLSPARKSFTYVDKDGQQRLDLQPGGWTLEFPASTTSSSGNTKNNSNGKASTLRMWIDVGGRHDINARGVHLPAGSRLLLQGKGWRETALEVGLSRIRPLQRRAQQTQQRLDAQLSHEKGDRRLDGTDLKETLAAYGDVAKLVWDRDEARTKLQEALRVYPPVASVFDASTNDNSRDDDDNDLPEGPWPGDVEWLSLSKDAERNPIYLLLEEGQDVQRVGTWSAEPILPEGVYEEVED